MQTSCIITQSNYIPWKGYFDAISKVDTFVVYDEMQYTKRDWRNRNLIKSSQGLKWLSIPVNVSGKFFQKINETETTDLNWMQSHLEILKQNYSKAAAFKSIWPWVQDLYQNCPSRNLSEINVYFLKAIMLKLEINTEIRYSSDFNLHEERTQRLVNICTELGSRHYYSGPAAKAYMDEKFFSEAGIEVHYFDYSDYLEYNQLFPPFEHGVSILDLLFNMGDEAINYYSNGK
jgi:hypothetical protein